MTMSELDTLVMTRQIRDAIYEHTKDLSHSERLAFYRAQAQAAQRRLGLSIAASSLAGADELAAEPVPAAPQQKPEGRSERPTG